MKKYLILLIFIFPHSCEFNSNKNEEYSFDSSRNFNAQKYLTCFNEVKIEEIKFS